MRCSRRRISFGSTHVCSDEQTQTCIGSAGMLWPAPYATMARAINPYPPTTHCEFCQNGEGRLVAAEPLPYGFAGAARSRQRLLWASLRFPTALCKARCSTFAQVPQGSSRPMSRNKPRRRIRETAPDQSNCKSPGQFCSTPKLSNARAALSLQTRTEKTLGLIVQ